MRCRACKESVSGVEPLACACTGATAELEPFYLFKLAIAAGGSRMEGVVFDDIAVEVIGVDASVYTEQLVEKVLVAQVATVVAKSGSRSGDVIFLQVQLPFLSASVFDILGLNTSSLDAPLESAGRREREPSGMLKKRRTQ
ncbi:hypothetical protein HDU91_003020 [Kappamyces sp. JEL0680]|nr:hypothetical protein HDU91_003020 [Kappamyces sp. JEL0680]